MQSAGVMIDTQVLIHACHYEIASAAKGQLRRHIENKQRKIPDEMVACATLIRRSDPVYISAISDAEFGNVVDELELEWKDRLGRRLVSLPMDKVIAETAASLLRQARRMPSIKNRCSVCLNSLDAHPCTGCNKSISAYHRFADAVIAATAQESDRVGVLYCYDTGILNGLAALLKNCRVERPPPPPPPPPPPAPPKPPSSTKKPEQRNLFEALKVSPPSAPDEPPSAFTPLAAAVALGDGSASGAPPPVPPTYPPSPFAKRMQSLDLAGAVLPAPKGETTEAVASTQPTQESLPVTPAPKAPRVRRAPVVDGAAPSAPTEATKPAAGESEHASPSRPRRLDF